MDDGVQQMLMLADVSSHYCDIFTVPNKWYLANKRNSSL